MKSASTMRGSDVSQISTYKQHLLRCNVNPLTRSGRITQLIGLVLLPLLSSIGLIIYSTIPLHSAANSYTVCKQLSKYVDVAVDTILLVEAVGEETSITLLELATEKYLLFGLVEEAYENELYRAGIMTEWPDDPEYSSINKFLTKLNELRSTTDQNKVPELVKFNQYLRFKYIFVDWIQRKLLSKAGETNWRLINALNHMIFSHAGIVIEKTFNVIYLLTGSLKSNELAMYIRQSQLDINHFNSSKTDSNAVYKIHADKYQDKYALNKDLIEKYREQIKDNAPIKPSLYDSVVAQRRYELYRKLLMEIINTLAGQIKDLNTKCIESALGEIIYYIIVIVLVTCSLLPFIILSAKRTTKSLLTYAVIMDRKSVELKREKRKIDAILNQMLPRAVAYRLKRGDNVSAEEFEEATVFFSDIDDFGEISTNSAPMQIVGFLNELYDFMDQQLGRYDVYKVETISCVYMVVSGVPMRNGKRHASEISRLALDTIYATEHFVIAHMPGRQLQLRIGAHTGPVVAGVIGNKTPRYCLFGDTVNTAARMQTTSKARKIQVSQSTKDALDEIGGYYLTERGKVEIKGKGQMTTYWLTSREGALYDTTVSAGSEDEECGR